jgi:tRNA/tmRNA/rRNA uracil-C5-methylase (TrmA/RlmC/RlmD family)
MDCSHRPPCPGCPRIGLAGIAPVAQAALAALAREQGVDAVAVVEGAPAGFRHRSRLAIRGRIGSPKIGMFELGTHHVVHIPRCLVHHPLINDMAAAVRSAMVEARMSTYSEAAHQGLVRYLQVAVERSSQTAQLVLVCNTAGVGPVVDFLDRLRERCGAGLHSLWLNRNTGTGNTILGEEFHWWHGPQSVVERFGGAGVHYPPGAFGQSNLDVAQALIAQVRQEIPPGSRVMELYAGVGAIGLSVLERAGALTLNELAAPSLQGLELGLAGLDKAQRSRVSVVPGPAGAPEAIAAAAHAEVIIADPPRKGLDRGLLDHLSGKPPERLLYVSCGLESFLEDTRRLLAGGRLRLTRLTAFNLVPYTDHVETLASFERA